jgi:hypothetical protein
MDYTKFEYRWHCLGIDSVLDLPSVAKLPELLHQNPQVTVSEKLIGYTICLSSRGYVASKSKIIAYKGNLSEKTYKTQPLKSLSPIFKKLAIIAKELQTLLNDVNLQVLIYGKWLFASNNFSYQRRNLLLGQFYAFGMGIVPGLNKDIDKFKLQNQFDWNVTFCNSGKKPYYLINLNLGLVQFLTSHKIKIVPVYGEFSMQQAFLDQSVVKPLSKNQISGAIFVWSDGLLQWRTMEGSHHYPNQYLGLIAIEKTIEEKFTPIYKNLQLVAYSFLGDQTKICLFNKLYNLAKDSLPSLPDNNRCENAYHNKMISHMFNNCREPVCDIAYFIKIKDQNNDWVIEKYKSDYEEHFPFWYK